nr:putative speedy protein E7 [Kogia breviceps]
MEGKPGRKSTVFPRWVPPLITQGPSSLLAAAQDGSPLASSSAPPEAVSEQRTRRMRGQKRKRLMDVKGAAQESSPLASSPTSPEAVSELKSWKKSSQRRNMWTVSHVEGTKLRMSKRRSSYRPEDQEAFYRLLEDPVIQSFLEADIFLKVSDKYLLSMVVEYFGRVGLPGHLYNRIHFFLALYIASDMEEDNPTAKQSIFQFLLGREHWPDLYKQFLRLKVEFFHAMEHRAWVPLDLCEEIQAQNPHHWVWSRARQCAP